MAVSLLSSPLSASTTHELVGSSSGLLPKSSFLANRSSVLLLTNPTTRRRRPVGGARYTISACSSKSLDHIPKRFRGENMDPALMENYKNVPGYLYGLPPSQLEMFMTENSPFLRQAESVTEESLSSKRFYMDNGVMSLSAMNSKKKKRSSLSSLMYRGAMARRLRSQAKPPDLPSLLLDARVVVLGMPIVLPVAELIIAQLLYLDHDPSKPIYLHINCSGTQNEKKQVVGSETDAYAIADTMALLKSRIYTVNLCMAFGQAAMLLSLGTPGCRIVTPQSYTKLYMPKVVRSSGKVSDMWCLAKDIYRNADSYLDLLAKGTGKDKEEIAIDIKQSRFFGAQATIDYGLADRIMNPNESLLVKRDYAAMKAEAQIRRAARAARLRAASLPKS